MIRVQLQPAYVLHVRPYRETSALVELLSRDHGRVAVVARGARGPKSRSRNTLQAFRPLLVSWHQRGELGTLTGADQVAAPPALAGEALYCGLYVNELLMRLLHRGDPHPEVFERYRSMMSELSGGIARQVALRLFEKHLLNDIGFGLLLEFESASQIAITSQGWYDYRPETGAVRVAGVHEGDRRLVSGQALQALRDDQISERDLPELRRMMRRVIQYHLGDKPLASHALFKGLKRESAS